MGGVRSHEIFAPPRAMPILKERFGCGSLNLLAKPVHVDSHHRVVRFIGRYLDLVVHALPNIAFATGDTKEIKPALGSASSSSTMRYF
jgi:hypothetical protein